MPRRDGPYVILTQISPSSYEIASLDNPGKPLGVYHTSALTPCNNDKVKPFIPLRKRGRPPKFPQTPGSSSGRRRNRRGRISIPLWSILLKKNIKLQEWVVVVVSSNSTCLTLSDRDPQNPSWQGARCLPVVGLSLEHHTGDGNRDYTGMWVRRGSTNLMGGKGSSESVQEFAARINKLGTQIFHSSNTTQNTAVRNANDQLLQSRFISGLRNDIRRFVLARDPNNLEESINAALIEEQNVKLNQIANDERTGLSSLQTETSFISALTNKLEENNLRVDHLQDASSVTTRKTGGGLFRRGETVFKYYYYGFQGHRQAECRKKRDGRTQSQLPTPRETPRANFLFSVTQALILSTGDASISRMGFSR
ncbi:uncharacterized protein TNCV_205021 [Trichonephila clavipes]|nr:uncharacterized protein TNCV_205021 [Trichonephila clavipes]